MTTTETATASVYLPTTIPEVITTDSLIPTTNQRVTTWDVPTTSNTAPTPNIFPATSTVVSLALPSKTETSTAQPSISSTAWSQTSSLINTTAQQEPSTESQPSATKNGNFRIFVKRYINCKYTNEISVLPLTDAKECEHLHNTSQLIVKYVSRLIHAKAFLSCPLGKSFYDGTKIRTIVCMPSGKWGSKLPKCKSTHFCRTLL